MRLYSTVESAANLEFSALAALEIVMAVYLSMWMELKKWPQGWVNGTP